MFLKARHFKDIDSVEKIRLAKSPVEAKEPGKHVSNFDKKSWNSVAEELMFKAMYLKFTQNKGLKEFLLATKRTELAEANASDLFWGTGLSLQNPDTHNPKKWVGKNIAGKVVSRIRDYYLRPTGFKNLKDYN